MWASTRCLSILIFRNNEAVETTKCMRPQSSGLMTIVLKILRQWLDESRVAVRSCSFPIFGFIFLSKENQFWLLLLITFSQSAPEWLKMMGSVRCL